MFTVGRFVPPHDASLLELAATIAPSTLGHMTERGFAHGLHAVTDANTFVGTAVTVRIPDTDSVAVHYAVDRLEPGHVLVVDMGGDRERASVGAMVAFTANARGAAGIVIDGMATDLIDLQEFGIPVFARGISAMTTNMKGFEGDVNVPVAIGGAIVCPGDVVLASADGVVFTSSSALSMWASDAVAAQTSEIQMKERILAGESLSSMSGAARLMEGRIDFV